MPERFYCFDGKDGRVFVAGGMREKKVAALEGRRYKGTPAQDATITVHQRGTRGPD
jgi:hypothetical protein